MKKIIFFIILFLLLSSPKKVYASAALELSNSTLDLASEGFEYLGNLGSGSSGYLPVLFTGNPLNEEYITNTLHGDPDTLYSADNQFAFVRPLSTSEQNYLNNENQTFFDSLNQQLSTANMFYAEIDNGYFTAKCYVDSNGDIVYTDSNASNPCIDVKHGGFSVSEEDWRDAFQEIFDSISQNGYIHSSSNLNTSRGSYYIFCGVSSKGANNSGLVMAYCPYIYNPNTHLNYNSSTGMIVGVYTNDPSFIQVSTSNGKPENYNPVLQTGNFTINNKTYKYYFNFNALTNLRTRSGTVSDWLAGNAYNVCFGYNNLSRSPSLAGATSDVIQYQPVWENGDYVQVGQSYGLSNLRDYAGSISQPSAKVYNPDFDATSSITTTNYPYSVAIPDDIALSPSVAFPDTMTFDPALTYPLDDTIDPTLITPNIPIISDLQNKFPFSIPWDIASILHGLEATRTTPYINTTVTIPGIDYEWHIEYDLSDFDDLAALFRTLFLIAFILGLAYFSYEHFFGS